MAFMLWSRNLNRIKVLGAEGFHGGCGNFLKGRWLAFIEWLLIPGTFQLVSTFWFYVNTSGRRTTLEPLVFPPPICCSSNQCIRTLTHRKGQAEIHICTWVLVTQSCGCGNVCVLRAVKVCSTLRMSVYSIVKVFVCHVTLNPFVSEKIMLFIKVVD